MKTLLLQHSLEDGFNHINKKLIDFLREPEKVLPEIVARNDDSSFQKFEPAPRVKTALKKATRA